MDSIIDINRLHNFDYSDANERFAYNQECERTVGTFVSEQIGELFHGQTEGYNPWFDYMLGFSSIEQKISSGMGKNGRHDGQDTFYVYIECGKWYRKDPESEPKLKVSGIHTTKADYFLTIMPGFHNNHSTLVGKIRLFSTIAIRQAMCKATNRLIDTRDDIIAEIPTGIETPLIPKSSYFLDFPSHAPETQYFLLNPLITPNYWVGNIDVFGYDDIIENGRIIGKKIASYDISKFQKATGSKTWKEWKEQNR